QTLNITLLQCVLMGLSVRGSGARAHVNVTSSILDSGALEFQGHFGGSSQILVAGSTLVTTLVHAIAFLGLTVGANSTLCLLDNRIAGNRYAIYLPNNVVVDGGGIIVKGNTLGAEEEIEGMESSVYVYAVDVRNGGYFGVDNNTMIALNGIYFYEGTTVSSAGLLRVADCTFVGISVILDSALVYFDGSVTLEGGAQWRVEGNNVSTASVLSMPYFRYKIKLLGSGSTVAIVHNRQLDSSV
ncbi:dispersed gene family protein 1 (DGF-1), putative, partial [Trypanosoma cruzi marinkellei]